MVFNTMTQVSRDAARPLEDAATLPDFAWLADDMHLLGWRGSPLERGPLATLSARVAAAFADHPSTTIVAGAIPFDRDADDYLFVARTWSTGSRKPPFLESANEAAVLDSGGIIEVPAANAYANAVARSVELMAEPSATLRKVVLARSLELATELAVDPHRLLGKVALDPSVTAFLVPLPPTSGPGWLVGATPELLVAKHGATIESFPLAGSASRHRDRDADRRVADALLRSEKDRREHRAVVEAILDTLNPYCRQLAVPAEPTLRSTASMWHLGTRIVGALKDTTTPSTDLLAALHPTPAVCGEPRDAAREAIRLLEPMDRGFYAGAAGWTRPNGDGEWYVSIRCAEIRPSRVRLYAGAGIVPGSDACGETRETAAKFNALLDALGMERTDPAEVGR